MNREQKAATIERLVAEMKGADAIFAVDYRGISVPQAAELRAKLRDADATFRVVKNSLTERAADQAGVEALKELLSGPTALTFVRGDAAVAARAIADYARVTQLLPFKGGLMDGGALDAEQVRSISRLPSREVLYGQLVGMVASPVTGLVRTLGALVGGLAVALGQVREKKESGEIPAGDPPVQAQAEPAPAAEPEAQAEAAPEVEVPAAEVAPEAASEAEAEVPAEAEAEVAPEAEAEVPAAEVAPEAEETPDADAEAEAPPTPAPAPEAEAEAPEAEVAPEAEESPETQAVETPIEDAQPTTAAAEDDNDADASA
jgi:large subunit ribosomal protein L10